MYSMTSTALRCSLFRGVHSGFCRKRGEPTIGYYQKRKLVIPTAGQFIESVTKPVMSEERRQPTAEDIQTALLLFPEPIVTLRAFRQSAPRFVRAVTAQEVTKQMSDLGSWGKVVPVKVPHNRPVLVFVKKSPTEVEWDANTIVERTAFETKFEMPVSEAVSNNILSSLRESGLLK